MFFFVMPSGRQKTLKIREDWKSSNRLCDGDDEEIKTKNTRTHTHNFDRGRRGEEKMENFYHHDTFKNLVNARTGKLKKWKEKSLQ